MAQNAQQKRVSKNRVSITFDVEDGGAVQQKELAFVTGSSTSLLIETRLPLRVIFRFRF